MQSHQRPCAGALSGRDPAAQDISIALHGELTFGLDNHVLVDLGLASESFHSLGVPAERRPDSDALM